MGLSYSRGRLAKHLHCMTSVAVSSQLSLGWHTQLALSQTSKLLTIKLGDNGLGCGARRFIDTMTVLDSCSTGSV